MLINYKNKKIFAFSDTHGMNNRLEIPEDVDILICCGDCTRDDMSDEEIIDFLKWYTQLPGRYKIFVPGNHDMLFETEPERAKLHFPTSVTLLEDCGVIIDDIYFFGVTCRPWRFENSEYDLPKEVDFLITHAPAKGHLDNNTGCEILKQMIDEGKPKYHIFGHIHELGLQQEVTPDTTYLNVSYYNHLLHHHTMHESLELENSGRRLKLSSIKIVCNYGKAISKRDFGEARTPPTNDNQRFDTTFISCLSRIDKKTRKKV